MSLGSRKGRILQAIVEDYVETADPIGSEWLVSHYDFGCKSATLRNEMAEMSDLGYLRQPHTSAGRIPSDRGYRYFVDRLMPPPAASSGRRALQSSQSSSSTMEDIVQQTCRILAGMTQYPSMATPPTGKAARLHRLFLSAASPTHALLVILLSTGDVEHRLVDLGVKTLPGTLEKTANYLNEYLAGIELSDLGAKTLGLLPTAITTHRDIVERVFTAVTNAARALAEERVILEGTSQLLRQPEFKDVARLEQLLSVLEQRSMLYQVLSLALSGEDVTVIIGEEAPFEAMKECSVVTSAYRIGDRVGGFIGIVGPTRMHYERTVGAVGLMARSLSDLLTKQSLT